MDHSSIVNTYYIQLYIARRSFYIMRVSIPIPLRNEGCLQKKSSLENRLRGALKSVLDYFKSSRELRFIR